jgi:putative peptide zinc metalloprotease protein
VLRPHGLQVVATGLGSIAVAAMAIGPIGAAVSFAGDPIRRRRVRPARAAFSTSAAAACVVLVLAVPMRYEIGAVARIDPGPARPIYVTVPGRIVDSVAIGDRVSKGDRIATLANDELAVELLELTAQRDAQRLRLDHLRQLRGDDLDADNQIPTAASALADLESRLARRREFAARLTPAAPIGGVVLPAAHRAGLPESDNARLCSWSGQPLDANHRGAELETETMICRVGDPARFDAVAYVDQSDIEQVRVGDAVRFRRSAVAPRVWHGCVTWIDQQPIEEVPDALLSDGRLPVHTGAGGAIRPRGTWYQVRIRLDATAGIDVPLTLESCGDVKIVVRPVSLGQRFLRFLRSTFRLA